jgi:hypothetical protein
MRGFAVNPYAEVSNDKINIVLNEGGVPPVTPSPMSPCYLVTWGDDAEHPVEGP